MFILASFPFTLGGSYIVICFAFTIRFSSIYYITYQEPTVQRDTNIIEKVRYGIIGKIYDDLTFEYIVITDISKMLVFRRVANISSNYELW